MNWIIYMQHQQSETYMTGLKRIILLSAIFISGITMICEAKPPLTGSFKIPQVEIIDSEIFGLVKDAISFAKDKDCKPTRYNIFFSYDKLPDADEIYQLLVIIEPTANEPWYKWDSYAIIDGYTCFFNRAFTSNFAKKQGDLRCFNYCYEEERRHYYGNIFEWRYRVFFKNIFLPKGSRAIIKWKYLLGGYINNPSRSEAEIQMKEDKEKNKRLLKFIRDNLSNHH